MARLNGGHLDQAREDAVAKERAELVALCKSLKSEHWTDAQHAGLDGLDRLDYYDAACEDIARAILARTP